MAFIETINLCQRRGDRETLHNINISVDRGEVFALIGPTGAGKTTLLRLIDLIDLPSSGKIRLDGQDTDASRDSRLALRRRMAFILQKPAVFNASVYDNIAFGLRCRGVAGHDIHQQVESVLEMVGLSAYRQRNARTLSGGEAERVAIGRGLAVKPEILLLDEPTANLDPRSADAIEALLVEIIKKDATTVIMSTHDMSQGQRLADRIAVLIDGAIQQKGSYGEVFNHPGTREVAEFVGVENIISGVITANAENIVTVAVNGGVIEAVADVAEGRPVAACVRPEDVTLSLEKAASSARNCFSGEVMRTVFSGPLARIEVNCGFRLVALVTKKSAEELSLKPGQRLYATFKATAVHVIRQR